MSDLSATAVASAVASGKQSAEGAARAALARIDACEAEIGAFIHLDPELVIAQARALDAQQAAGKKLGPLHGVPVAIKDIIDTADQPTQCGSPIMAGRRPQRDATVVAKLRAAGAVIVGKTVTTEFAYFHPGKTRNPRDLSRTPGGSSSGSAAAVASGMVPLAIGSQTNGSVIRPASFCGVYGIKPSYGLVSRAGVLPISRSLDHVGPFARSLSDLSLALDVIAGRDPLDPDTGTSASPNCRARLDDKWQCPPRFAFVRTPVWNKAEASTRLAFEKLASDLGGDCEVVELPEPFDAAWNAQRAIMAVEMTHNLSPILARDPDGSSAVLKDLMAEGRKVSATDYLKMRDTARILTSLLTEMFGDFDAMITPATLGVAPMGIDTTGNPLFCSLWSLVGLPSLTLPLLKGEEGLPLGVQLIGPSGRDADLMRAGHWLEQTAGALP